MMPHIRVRGVQMHIGSQITEAGAVCQGRGEGRARGGGVEAALRHRVFSASGAGWASCTNPRSRAGRKRGGARSRQGAPSLTVEEYANAIVPALQGLGLRILLEPGRFMVGNAGVLLSTVQYLKTSDSGKRFVIVDAGMNDLIRPALYQGYHEVVPVREPAADDPRETADVVGPVCESGDFFAQARELPPLRQGELIALMSAGAYGFTMASNYNSRPLAAEVLVSGDAAQVVRERQKLDDLIRGERTGRAMAVAVQPP